LEVGEWWKADGVWVRLSKYAYSDTFPAIRIVVEFWNKTDGPLLFSWNTSGNLSLVDNTGHSYPLTGQFSNAENRLAVVDAGELVEITNRQFGYIAIYEDEFLFDTSVTELIFTLTDFSRIAEAQFRIPVAK
jgi:hypothetical protein